MRIRTCGQANNKVQIAVTSPPITTIAIYVLNDPRLKTKTSPKTKNKNKDST
jgi:hypothetical protein